MAIRQCSDETAVGVRFLAARYGVSMKYVAQVCNEARINFRLYNLSDADRLWEQRSDYDDSEERDDGRNIPNHHLSEREIKEIDARLPWDREVLTRFHAEFMRAVGRRYNIGNGAKANHQKID